MIIIFLKKFKLSIMNPLNLIDLCSQIVLDSCLKNVLFQKMLSNPFRIASIRFNSLNLPLTLKNKIMKMEEIKGDYCSNCRKPTYKSQKYHKFKQSHNNNYHSSPGINPLRPNVPGGKAPLVNWDLERITFRSHGTERVKGIKFPFKIKLCFNCIKMLECKCDKCNTRGRKIIVIQQDDFDLEYEKELEQLVQVEQLVEDSDSESEYNFGLDDDFNPDDYDSDFDPSEYNL
ncbi:hypothetical protein IIV25_132R [Invertebrate iridovirus 25]|uniref:Uncharacterized protein n=1 Tax=Invertebrate iridovirus 25 TaxID=1301280 RepID=W8W2G2_9VIRU|nr:hypothetical protein IIV25_132R [Invertebrate iridovirus 25]CCV02150.1 hypothetical protein IIV25_132R [Invertebrate iridovirus 25]